MMSEKLTDESGSAEWQADCLKWRGVLLTGKFGHWCDDYDGLPVDETCENEWPCTCYPEHRLGLANHNKGEG